MRYDGEIGDGRIVEVGLLMRYHGVKLVTHCTYDTYCILNLT